jgi:tRNA (guanine-N7-)-methyltransferase
MSRNSGLSSDYLTNYLQRLCKQNQELFNSPFIWKFQPGDLPLYPRRHFQNCSRTFLEIGFGHGEVLEELVPRRPDMGFVGIERRPARVRKALKRLNRIGAPNALLIRINLELFLEPLFAPGSFDEILINHPDPWPKSRHEHHRFFRPEIIDWLAFLLSVGGIVEVASDHVEYFFRILLLFEEDPRFESLLRPPFYSAEVIPDRPLSRYERKKRAAGSVVLLLRFSKK